MLPGAIDTAWSLSLVDVQTFSCTASACCSMNIHREWVSLSFLPRLDEPWALKGLRIQSELRLEIPTQFTERSSSKALPDHKRWSQSWLGQCRKRFAALSGWKNCWVPLSYPWITCKFRLQTIFTSKTCSTLSERSGLSAASPIPFSDTAQ